MFPRSPPAPVVTLKSYVVPSPRVDRPVNALRSVCRKFLRVMMFTTPATASDPYTAEAPSFSTSMRSMAAVGIEFRSTDESAPVPPGTMRRPFKRARVRESPRPRRLTRVDPSPPLLTAVLIELPCSGRLCRKSPIDTLPLATTCSRLMTVTGAGVVRSLRRMRDPVTVISSSAARLPAA